MKATVTIDLPDGWELADTKMRKAKPGEYRWLPAVGKPYRLESASEGECFIVRRIAEQYVNVRLRREDAAHFAGLDTYDHQFLPTYQLILACAESLSERCETMVCGDEWGACRYTSHTTRRLCGLPTGHAGEHGV